jgi:hypothetical protein
MPLLSSYALQTVTWIQPGPASATDPDGVETTGSSQSLNAIVEFVTKLMSDPHEDHNVLCKIVATFDGNPGIKSGHWIVAPDGIQYKVFDTEALIMFGQIIQLTVYGF